MKYISKLKNWGIEGNSNKKDSINLKVLKFGIRGIKRRKNKKNHKSKNWFSVTSTLNIYRFENFIIYRYENKRENFAFPHPCS